MSLSLAFSFRFHSTPFTSCSFIFSASISFLSTLSSFNYVVHSLSLSFGEKSSGALT